MKSGVFYIKTPFWGFSENQTTNFPTPQATPFVNAAKFIHTTRFL